MFSAYSVKDRILILVLSFVVGTFFSFVLTEPVNDMSLYMAASQLFWMHKNPYSQLIWTEFWQLNASSQEIYSKMIWNPPEIFIILLPFNLLSMIGNWLIQSVNMLLAFHLHYLALFVIKPSGEKLLLNKSIIIFSLCNFAILYTLKFSQISIYLCWMFMLVLYNLRKGSNFWAGALSILLLVKPHIFAIPLAILFVGTLTQKRQAFIVGAFVSAIVLFFITEISFSGVHNLWISREAWPVHVYGANLPNILRLIVRNEYHYDPAAESLVFLVLYVAILINACRKEGFGIVYRFLPLTLIILPFISPYGFMFDLVLYGVPYLWASALILSKDSRPDLAAFSMLISFLGVLLILSTAGPVDSIVWVLAAPLFQPLILMLGWFYLDKKYSVSLKFAESFSTQH